MFLKDNTLEILYTPLKAESKPFTSDAVEKAAKKLRNKKKHGHR